MRIYFKYFIYLFLREGEKHQCVLASCSATQVCALTENQTCDLLVRRLALNPLSHTSQGQNLVLREIQIQTTLSTIFHFSDRQRPEGLIMSREWLWCRDSNHRSGWQRLGKEAFSYIAGGNGMHNVERNLVISVEIFNVH